MVWNIFFYGSMVVSVLWLLFTCFWVCVKLFKAEDPIEDDAASYVTIPRTRRLSGDQQPLPYELATISRDSLRHRSNENINFDRDDRDERDGSSETPYSTSGSYSLEGSSQYESSGKGSSIEDSVRSKEDSSVRSKYEEGNVSSKTGEASVKSETGEGSVSSKTGEASVSKLGEGSVNVGKGDNSFNSKNDSGIKSNVSEDDREETKLLP